MSRLSPSRVRRVPLALLTVLAVWLAVPLGAAAQVTAPTLDVRQVGWDGTSVPATWSPIRVRVGGANGTARLEVVLQQRFQASPLSPGVPYPMAAYGQEVVLSTDSQREITVWVPADGFPLASVRLTRDGTTLAERTVELRYASTPAWPLVGVLAQSPTIAQQVGRIELPYQGLPAPVSVARLTAEDLPPYAERLGALNAIVVQGDAAALLTHEQRRAIREWVADGGHLVLMGGPDALRAAGVLPSDSIPGTFGSLEVAADLSPLAAWVGSSSPPGSGPAASLQMTRGTPLAGLPGRPLAWRSGLGRGTLTFLAFDLALEPLASWTGSPTLLHKALESSLPAPGEDERAAFLRAQQRNTAQRLQSAADALPTEAFPTWDIVGMLLGGFGLVVGPLAYVVLWRVDRRGWIWLVVPALALLVSAGVYAATVRVGGRDVTANVLSYVRVDPESGQLRQSVAAAFFAPSLERLSVNVAGDQPVRALGRIEGVVGTQPGAGAAADPPVAITTGRDTRVDFSAGQWAQRLVFLERPIPTANVVGVAAHLTVEQGLIRGTVRNDSAYQLEDAAVLVGNGFAKLGTLAPGQTTPIALEPSQAINTFKGGSAAMRLFGTSTNRDSFEPPRDIESTRRMRLMDAATMNFQVGLGPPPQSVPLTFVAFIRDALGAVPSAGRHPTYALTLVQQPLELEFPPGPFVLPTGLTLPEQLSVNSPYGVGTGGSPTLQWTEIRGGSVVYGLRPPLPASARVDALVLTTQQVGGAGPFSATRGAPIPIGPSTTPTPPEADVFSVYNWHTATWEALPAGQEHPRLAPAAPYIGPDGVIKVQVTSGADRLVRFITPEVSVEGSVSS